MPKDCVTSKNNKRFRFSFNIKHGIYGCLVYTLHSHLVSPFSFGLDVITAGWYWYTGRPKERRQHGHHKLWL